MKEYTRSEIEKRRAARRRRLRRRKMKRAAFVLSVILLVSAAGVGGVKLIRVIGNSLNNSSDASGAQSGGKRDNGNLASVQIPDWIDVQLIPKGNARKGLRLSRVKYIVVHYVGNPGTTAQNNRDYFAKDDTEVCSHFVIGLNGEIIQCVPLGERSAASNERNKDSVSIEVCHPDDTGKFNDATYNSLTRLTAWLCENAGLTEEGVIRHYDVTGKLCPLYYVKNPAEWDKFRSDIKELLQGEKQNA